MAWRPSPRPSFIPLLCAPGFRSLSSSPFGRPPSVPVVGVFRSRRARFSCSSAPAEWRNDGVRVNKCFKSQYSRRESDALISQGRVTVNGTRAQLGTRVVQGDEVALDGNVVEWERLTLGKKEVFTYLKFHKPLGVVTTTDLSIPNNIISCLEENGYNGKDRVFMVGRLDEQTTGLILCTTDGALVEAALGKDSPSSKEYMVETDLRVSDDDCAALRAGVVIKTVAQSSQGRKPLVAPTIPCTVERIGGGTERYNVLRIVLREGRNRQIRKMLGAVGNYTVRSLQRVSFLGITLDGIENPGSWAPLNDAEMNLVRDCLAAKEKSETLS